MTDEEHAAVEALRGCLENVRESIGDLFQLQQRGNATADELLDILTCLDSIADVIAQAVAEFR